MIKLPFWLSGPLITQLKIAAQSFWKKAEAWVNWPLSQFDADTCVVGVLDLLAFQRKIKRFNDEPLDLYRKRVKFAFVNAVDAGSVAGFQRIFTRLGIGYVEVIERMPARDWDILSIRLSNQDVWFNNDLLKVLIQDYGRTCRRYEFESVVLGEASLSVAAVGHTYVVERNDVTASAEVTLECGFLAAAIKHKSYVFNSEIEATTQ